MIERTSEGQASTPRTPEIGAVGSSPAAPGAAYPPHRPPASHRAPTRKGAVATVLKGIANIVFLGLIIYLTYFFTLFFSTRPPAPAPASESVTAAAKKIEEQRAEERKLLTTYGPLNPVTKTVRIPVDRAMELIVAESSQPTPAREVSTKPVPVAPVTTAGAAAKAEAVATTTKAAAPAAPIASTAPAPAPARVGMAPDQLYRAICIACHDVDGRGTIVRKAMPAIPDLTDAKWQASRSDAELLHSVLEGKGQFMLPMKDKFALAHTDPKEMVAFMRSFQSGKQVVAAAAPTQPPAVATASPVVASGPIASAEPPHPLTAPASSPVVAAAPAPAATASSATILTQPNPAQGLQPAGASLVALGPTPSSIRTPSTAPSPANSAKLRVAGEFYGINCIACHGQDGRGTAVRVAMPLLPDFTTREWQTSRANPQLSVSILEGKGLLMPPWRGRVTPELAQDLIAFVRTFGPAGLTAQTAPTSEFAVRFKDLQKQWDEINVQVQALSRP
jgi:mono/diheme cytochrome c family protein